MIRRIEQVTANKFGPASKGGTIDLHDFYLLGYYWTNLMSMGVRKPSCYIESNPHHLKRSLRKWKKWLLTWKKRKQRSAEILLPS